MKSKTLLKLIKQMEKHGYKLKFAEKGFYKFAYANYPIYFRSQSEIKYFLSHSIFSY